MTAPSRADQTGPLDPGWRAAGFVILLVAAYCAGLWWLDRSNGTFQRLSSAWHWLSLATLPVFASYLVRYWRWRWLLRRNGDLVPFARGLYAYLAGFALTATPGKAGELLRIRYFSRMAVPASRTVAAFVFERALDLLVILLLSFAAAPIFPGLATLACVVLAFVLALFAVVCWRRTQHVIERAIAWVPTMWMRRACAFVLSAVRTLDSHLDTRALWTGLGTGVLAWGLTSAVFMGVCAGFGVAIEPLLAFGIYPLAMLVGALSFVPGGVGTTELTIVLMLNRLGVATDDALAVAVGTRLITLWFATGVGGGAVLVLEKTGLRHASDPR